MIKVNISDVSRLDVDIFKVEMIDYGQIFSVRKMETRCYEE